MQRARASLKRIIPWDGDFTLEDYIGYYHLPVAKSNFVVAKWCMLCWSQRVTCQYLALLNSWTLEAYGPQLLEMGTTASMSVVNFLLCADHTANTASFLINILLPHVNISGIIKKDQKALVQPFRKHTQCKSPLCLKHFSKVKYLRESYDLQIESRILNTAVHTANKN